MICLPSFCSITRHKCQLTVQPGNTVSFEFSKQPKKIDAFITDYDGDIPSVYPLKKVGASTFQISGPLGIRQIEVHTTFPNIRRLLLANVQGNFKSQSLAPLCGTQNRLQIAGVTDSNNSKSAPNSIIIAHYICILCAPNMAYY
jgi:hypothetical protein